jgi:hypothetical protein
MDKIIDKHASIQSLVQAYPEFKDILFGLGFTDIVKPGMLQTVGRIMTLNKGAALKNVSWETIVDVLKNHGFQVKE